MRHLRNGAKSAATVCYVADEDRLRGDRASSPRIGTGVAHHKACASSRDSSMDDVIPPTIVSNEAEQREVRRAASNYIRPTPLPLSLLCL
jgi:hypothetical protein